MRSVLKHPIQVVDILPFLQGGEDVNLELSGKGESLRGICRALEAAGIARKKGTLNWHPQTVLDILKRERKAA